MSRFSRALLPALGGAVAGGAIALAVASGSTTTHNSFTTTVVRSSGQPTAFAIGHGLTVNQIYKQASPGVVDITVTSTNNNGFGLPSTSTGEGSGVVYDTNGDILTDEHVVSGAQKVIVKFQNGLRVPAKVLGTDPSTDVAVIKVNVPSSQLHPIPLANSNEARVGDAVVAIGSPFSLPETVTAGIVSQTGRPITAPNNYTITNAIQTDAAINPGNSGGPLLDASGRVLGLNDQIETNNQNAQGQGSSSGVGFAVPSNTVAQVAGVIISGHAIRHAYVGVSLDQNSVGGARIATQPDQQGRPPIIPGSPAATAGLKPGDLITAIDSHTITTTEQFIATIDTYSPGDAITLTVKRGGATSQIKLKLGTRPASTSNGG